MGRSKDRPGNPDTGNDETRAGRVLEALGLPLDDELVELVELGIAAAAAARLHGSPELLADFLDFARDRLAVLGAGTLTPDRFARFARLLAGDVEDNAPVDDVVEQALARLPALPATGEPTLGPLAATYVEHVLSGDRARAIAVVVDCARAGMPVSVLLTDVLEAAQREIGRRWQEGQVTIAQEHFCTAVTQFALAALHPYLFERHAAGRQRRRLVAVQAGDGMHQVGLRMVVDLLEHDGWDTTYLGAQDDPGPVVEALADQRASVLAVSASMPADVAHAEALVRAVRADPRTSTVRIIVGGRAFLVAPALAERVGADGLAHDAREAVALCAAHTDDVAV